MTQRVAGLAAATDHGGLISRPPSSDSISDDPTPRGAEILRGVIRQIHGVGPIRVHDDDFGTTISKRLKHNERVVA